MIRPPAGPHYDPDARSGLRQALGQLARQAHASIGHADGVGVTLLLDGAPLHAASNTFAARIDEVQYRLDEGPCVSALTMARIVHTSEVGGGELRWSRFTASASDLALRSAVSTPLLTGDVAIGTLNLYGRAPETFATALPSIVRCTEEVGKAVHALHLLATTQASSRSLLDALSARAEVELAVGILIDRYAMTPGAARVLLSQLARLDDVTVVVAARGLIEGRDER